MFFLNLDFGWYFVDVERFEVLVLELKPSALAFVLMFVHIPSAAYSLKESTFPKKVAKKTCPILLACYSWPEEFPIFYLFDLENSLMFLVFEPK